MTTPESSIKMEMDAPPNPTSTSIVDTLTLQVIPENSNVQFKKEHEMYVAVNVTSCEDIESRDTAPERKPIDLVVVLDRSGSMSGEKLRMCKATCKFVVQELHQTDRLGIVTFGSDVIQDLPITSMSLLGKTMANFAIGRIQTSGCTNLSGGLFEGLEMLNRGKAESESHIKAVLLLTDGHANEGVYEPSSLVALTRQAMAKMGDENLKLFSFGYGSDHQSQLLRDLSEISSGMYYYVENNSQVAEAFGDCLGGLMSVVAQQVQVQVTTRGGCTFVGDPLGKAYKWSKPTEDQLNFVIPDMFFSESKDLLFQVKLPKLTSKVEGCGAPVVHVAIKYMDVRQVTIGEKEVELCVHRDESTSGATTEVSRQVKRLLVAQAMSDAQARGDLGDYKGAQGILSGVKMAFNFKEDPDKELDELDRMLNSDLTTTIATLQPMKWEEHGRYANNRTIQEHLFQRGNRSGMMVYRKEGGQRTKLMSKAKNFLSNAQSLGHGGQSSHGGHTHQGRSGGRHQHGGQTRRGWRGSSK